MDQPARYRIHVQGCLDERRSDWFGGMHIAVRGGGPVPPITILTGTLADQAALMGLLQKVYILGLPLLSVTREIDEEMEQ